jgi:hypothetical protein
VALFKRLGLITVTPILPLPGKERDQDMDRDQDQDQDHDENQDKDKDRDQDSFESTNCTLVNLMLVIFGPMRENNLCSCILVFQILCSFIAFFIRYVLSRFFY